MQAFQRQHCNFFQTVSRDVHLSYGHDRICETSLFYQPETRKQCFENRHIVRAYFQRVAVERWGGGDGHLEIVWQLLPFPPPPWWMRNDQWPFPPRNAQERNFGNVLVGPGTVFRDDQMRIFYRSHVEIVWIHIEDWGSLDYLPQV